MPFNPQAFGSGFAGGAETTTGGAFNSSAFGGGFYGGVNNASTGGAFNSGAFSGGFYGGVNNASTGGAFNSGGFSGGFYGGVDGNVIYVAPKYMNIDIARRLRIDISRLTINKTTKL
jgi:hypothetical protein